VSATPAFGPDGVVELTLDLISIDSSNPALVASGAGETQIASYISLWLAARGFICHSLESLPGRPSIVAVAPGIGGGRTIMLNGHIDTVSLDSYSEGKGLNAEVRGGNIYGRGAYDMKSGIAAMMVAAATAARTGDRRGDILLALVADEEYGSAGTEEVLRLFTADGAIVVEPSGLDITVAHRGFAWLDVVINGTAAHGSRPDLGVDAITKAGRFLTGLEELAHALADGPAHPLLNTGNIHASLIAGGEELSSYPARCTISVERRTIPGESGETALQEVKRLLDDIASSDPDFRYELELRFERSSFAADLDSAIVNTLTAAVEKHTGRAAVYRGEPFWTDCALLNDAGIPAVLFGVAGAGAHAATEWVTTDSLITVTRALEDALIAFAT
jgi:acetylornithine deacetylase